MDMQSRVAEPAGRSAAARSGAATQRCTRNLKEPSVRNCPGPRTTDNLRSMPRRGCVRRSEGTVRRRRLRLRACEVLANTPGGDHSGKPGPRFEREEGRRRQHAHGHWTLVQGMFRPGTHKPCSDPANGWMQPVPGGFFDGVSSAFDRWLFSHLGTGPTTGLQRCITCSAPMRGCHCPPQMPAKL